MKNLIYKKSLFLLLISLPLYFRTDSGIPLISFIFLLISPIIFYRSITYRNCFLFFLYYCIVILIQCIIINDININYFILRFLSIEIFICTLFFIMILYKNEYDKYLLYSFFICLIYGVYSSLSYVLGYSEFLILGTCEDNNLSSFGTLRCATFGEGNYYGIYISLMILVFCMNRNFMLFSLVAALIAFSPPSLIIWSYIFIRKNILVSKNRINIFFLIFFISIAFLFVVFVWDFKDLIGDSNTSSFWERIEFSRAGIKMWLDNIFIGVGMGQYGNNLIDYTNFQHLKDGIIFFDKRYIANSNIPEILSEMGILGSPIYIYLMRKIYALNHPVVSGIELLLIFIFIGLTMPTIFLLYVSVLLGVLFHKFSNTNNFL